MRILKKGNNNKKSLAYTALVRPTLKYGAVCWDHIEKRSVKSLKLGAKRSAKFANNINESGWEPVAQRRLITRICALFKAYTGRRCWKAIGEWNSKIMQYLVVAIIIGKSGLGNKEEMLVNIPL
jgi:hypothetical protein